MSIELKRIGWQDEPSEETPIDSGNLKQMENNTEKALQDLEIIIEKLIPVNLWEGETNDANVINLSDNIQNYKRIKVFYRDNDSQNGSVEVINKNNSDYIKIGVISCFNQAQWFNIKQKSFALNGNRGEGIGAAEYEFGSQTISYNNNIFILRIEGYKY